MSVFAPNTDIAISYTEVIRPQVKLIRNLVEIKTQSSTQKLSFFKRILINGHWADVYKSNDSFFSQNLYSGVIDIKTKTGVLEILADVEIE